MAMGYDSYLDTQFSRWAEDHVKGCDFHEDAPERAVDRKTKRFREKKCTCHEVMEDQREEAMGW